MREVLSNLKTLGRLVAVHSGPDDKHPVRQLADLALLRLNGRLGLFQYYTYLFYRKDAPSLGNHDYMGLKTYRRLQRTLNDPAWLQVLGNKWYFHMHFGRFGLPLPILYGIFSGRNGMTGEGSSLRSAGDLSALIAGRGIEHFVVKPVDGSRGRQVLVLDRTGKDEYTALDGKAYTLRDLAHHMTPGCFLVEGKVFQHPVLHRINRHTINSFRIVTFRDIRGTSRVHHSSLRLGRKGSNTDNVSGGGLAVHVDRHTGRLGHGHVIDLEKPAMVTSHPDTGVEFTGLEVPLWRDVLTLCLRAADVSPLGSVGWDIVLSPGGPVLIEGNAIWDSRLLSQRLAAYLQPDVREDLREYGIQE